MKEMMLIALKIGILRSSDEVRAMLVLMVILVFGVSVAAWLWNEYPRTRKGIAAISLLLVIATAWDYVRNYESPGQVKPSKVSVYSYNNVGDGNVIGGQYSCSDSISDIAKAMRPDESITQQLDAEQNSLLVRQGQLETEKQLLDKVYGYVNNSNQYSVNKYNEGVNIHNAALKVFQTDSDSLNERVGLFNFMVKRYNDYLENNCIKRQ